MDNKTTPDFLSKLIGTLGFPIVVAGWLLYERSTMLSAFMDAINNNTVAIQQLAAQIGAN